MAQAFLEANELPSSYLDQIADFLIKNTSATSLGPSTRQDPYASSQAAARQDPYSSASPAVAPATRQDPYASSQPAATPQYKELPATEYLFFRAANLKAIFNKLVALNA